MEEQNKLMDTTVTGAILIFCFAMPSVIMIPSGQLPTSIIAKIFLNDNNLLAKWVAVGVLLHILGSIISVAAICTIRRPFENNRARWCLRHNVLQWIESTTDHGGDPDKKICSEAYEKIKKMDPDSIWAWIHYSDSRKELINWGRRKLHYAYLAENWMIAIAFGGIVGCFVAYLHPCFDWRRIPGLCFFIVISGVAVLFLRKMRRKNIDWDNDMVAMYVAARIWRGLEDRFLPSLTREKEIQKTNP